MRKNFLFLLSESPFSGDYLHALSFAKELAAGGATVLFCYESSKERYKIYWTKDDSDNFVSSSESMEEGLPVLTNPGLYRCAIPNFTLLNAHAQGWSFSALLAKLRIVRGNFWDKIFVFQSHADSVIPALWGKLRAAEVVFVRNEPFGGKTGILRTDIWGGNAHQSMAGFIRGYRNIFYGARWIGDKIYHSVAKPVAQIQISPTSPSDTTLGAKPVALAFPFTVGIAFHTNRDEAFLLRCMLTVKKRVPQIRFLIAGNSFEKLDPGSYKALASSIRHIGELSEVSIRALIEESSVFLQTDSPFEFRFHGIMKGAMMAILQAEQHIFLLHDSNTIPKKDSAIPSNLHICNLAEKNWLDQMTALATKE